MIRPLGAIAACLIYAAACFPAQAQSHAPSIRRVQVLRGTGQVEVEIEASDRVVPQTHEIQNPDRLVVDFVNAIPGSQLRPQTIHRGEVKGLRIGLFSADPPVTRVVLDLNGPQPYQVFPSGRTVIVKIGAGSSGAASNGASASAAARNASYHPSSAPALVNTSAHIEELPLAPPTPKPLEVLFHDGLLSISSDKSSLSEILFAIHQRTGAEIAIPAGAEQEKVMAELGPAPAPEVLAHLLNGTRFNFLILSSATDPHGLDQIILTPRADGPISAPRPQPHPMPQQDEDEAIQSAAPQPPVRPTPPPQNPNPAPDGQTSPPPNADNPD